jgi:hypothetical protein
MKYDSRRIVSPVSLQYSRGHFTLFDSTYHIMLHYTKYKRTLLFKIV